MVTIVYEASPYNPRKTANYTYAHTARTILLLAGYLPHREDEDVESEDTYINLYTRELAYLTIRK